MKITRDFIFDPSLVLYLPLYELDGDSFMSKDAYGHLCTVTGALWRPNGRELDGLDDKIVVPASSLTNLVNEFTVEAWVQYIGLTDSYYMSKKQSGASIGFTLSGNTWGILGGGVGGWHWCAHTDLRDGVWHHGVATYKKSLADGNMKFYIEGQFDTEADYTGGAPSYQEEIDIGANYVPDTYWNGIIGEVRIYSRALTPLEIQHNYLATKWRYR